MKQVCSEQMKDSTVKPAVHTHSEQREEADFIYCKASPYKVSA